MTFSYRLSISHSSCCRIDCRWERVQAGHTRGKPTVAGTSVCINHNRCWHMIKVSAHTNIIHRRSRQDQLLPSVSFSRFPFTLSPNSCNNSSVKDCHERLVNKSATRTATSLDRLSLSRSPSTLPFDCNQDTSVGDPLYPLSSFDKSIGRPRRVPI